MKKNGFILTGFLLVLLGIQMPQFAQNTSTGPTESDRTKRWISVNLLRTINTAEVAYQQQHGSYTAWQTLLSSEPKYFEEFFARNNPENVVRNGLVRKGQPGVLALKQQPLFYFLDAPDILPGWDLRLNVHADGQGYDVLLRDLTDKKCGYAALTDESGVIRQSKPIDCEI